MLLIFLFLATGFSVEVRFTTDHEKYLDGVRTVNAIVDVEVSDSNLRNEYPPMELALVLDRSGSMHGKKLEHAKNAAKNVVNKLRKGDILHLITYDTDVDIVFNFGTATEKRRLLNKIEEIETAGATNLAGGLDSAYELLSPKTSSKDRFQRIFLLSDGLANVGETRHTRLFAKMEEMHKQGITVCTFGIGEDHDQELLRGLSEYGAGEYYYISDAHEIDHLVDHALRGLGSTIGLNAILQFQPHSAVTEIKLVGGSTSSVLETGIPLNDLRVGSRKTYLIEVKIKTSVSSGKGEETVPVLKWKLSYEPTHKDKGNVDSVELNGSFSVTVTKVEAETNQVNKRVEARMKLAKIVELEAEVLNYLDKGDRERAKTTQKTVMEMYDGIPQNADTDADNYIQTCHRRAQKSAEVLSTATKSNKEARYSYFWQSISNPSSSDSFHDEL